MFEHIFKGSPDQPRDEHGRWVDADGATIREGDEVRINKDRADIGGKTYQVVGGSRDSGFIQVGRDGVARHSVHASDVRVKPKPGVYKPSPKEKPSNEREYRAQLNRRFAPAESPESKKQHNLDQISVLANDIRNNNGTREEQMDKYHANLKKFEDVFKYDENQPRDGDGKWSDGGGGSEADQAEKLRQVFERSEARIAARREAYSAVATPKRLTEEDKALGSKILTWAKTGYGEMKGPDGLKIWRKGRSKYTVESKRMFNGKRQEVDYSGLRFWLTEHFKRGSK